MTFERAKELIGEKKKADVPIASYQGLEVVKGIGRFGPFIKWNNNYINVTKKYNFDNLTQQDVEELIEGKLKKESEKVVKEWDEGEVRIEKARWGRFTLIKGKTKVELPKDTNVESFTKEEALASLAEKEPKPKATTKRTATKVFKNTWQNSSGNPHCIGDCSGGIVFSCHPNFYC